VIRGQVPGATTQGGHPRTGGASWWSTRDADRWISGGFDSGDGQAHRPVLVVVDLASVAERHDYDQEQVVSDGVDDPVIADPNAETGPAPKRS
jgi:hypothetical protein